MASRHTILLASDLSAASDRVAGGAIKLARSIGARVVTMHVVTQEAMAEALRELPEDQSFVDVVVSHISQNLIEQVARIADGEDIEVIAKVIEGTPEDEILREIEQGDYAYTIIGVRNRSRVGKLILGSVTQEVLLGAHRPIVAVPTED